MRIQRAAPVIYLTDAMGAFPVFFLFIGPATSSFLSFTPAAGTHHHGHPGLYNGTTDVETGDMVADSLFAFPGLLLLEAPELRFSLLAHPHLFDLSRFNAQIVSNATPFAFNQSLVAAHKHAQHRLRVVAYNLGDRYLDDYLLKEGSGNFIERHEFIQAITPLTPECGGFVLLGREVTVEAEGGTTQQLELVACPVPYGFTLLVEVGSIHGDSTLTGLYMMAMTGNHVAMATADTVFLKHRCSRANVRVSCTEETAPPVVPGLPGSAFLLTS